MAGVQTNKRAMAHARRQMGANGSRTFMSGLLFGLSSASLVFSGEILPPKVPKEGISSDWKAVGSDIAKAMRKRG